MAFPDDFIRAAMLILCSCIVPGWLKPVHAVTDLASAPVNYLIASQVKPNIYFILDDSGSMNWSFMGDEVVANGYEKTVGYRSHLCNKIYYNPAVTYPVPVRPDGTPYPSQSFTSASYDGFNPQSVTVNLSISFTAWRTASSVLPVPVSTESAIYRADCGTSTSACTANGSGDYPNLPEPAYYFVYRGNHADHLGDNSSADECREAVRASSSSNWSKIVVGSSSGPNGKDERGNFANWYSYHRTRVLTMKTALGRALRDFDEQFRVGFSAISDSGVDSAKPGFLKIADFDATQKQQLYAKLYAIDSNASTPLRAALSKAGRLYAGKLSDTDDPVQFSCQQNFTILSTDGYWNTAGEKPGYGPRQIDGTTDVGDQDHDLPRPFTDGDPDGGKVRAARLVLTPALTSAAKTMIVDSVTVDGVELMSTLVGVYTTTDLPADAIRLGIEIETWLRRSGYHAVAQGAVVYVIAPAGASPAQTPVIRTRGAISIAAEPFQEIARASRLANTLADVAAYYFNTDLRQPAFSNCPNTRDVCTNNVPVLPGQPGGSHQHMVTHTLGLGASGTLRYQEDYEQASSGDFRDIVNGKRAWPDPMFFSGPERIDDLWHAAVNGGGHYFNASSPESLAKALVSAMTAIRSATGAAAAAATSNQEPAEGDNLLFATRYRSIYWDGEIEARRIGLSDGSISADIEWAASAQLDSKVGSASDARSIWLQSASNLRLLKQLVWSELDATERSYFLHACETAPVLSQCANFSDSEKSALTGERLLNYLRGQRGFEDRPDNELRLFRRREHVLGATTNAQPVYVGRPAFRYADDNYGAFRDERQASRKGIVYVAANDGMLHAFSAATGAEVWAMVPAGVLPRMRIAADQKYGKQFTYLLDGTPVAADICPGTTSVSCSPDQWRTILVAGMGAAGREFYALDITDPDRPSALWRFNASSDNDLGYALGRPLITKQRDGRWIVLLTSGYNNVNPGSGKGFLYVLDAYTGELLQKIGTGAGSASAPSGLAQLNGWVESLLDNTGTRFYAGDLLGNVWRFDIDDLYPPQGREAMLLAQLARNGTPQSITTRPELSEVRVGTQRISLVTVATGSYLGLSDAADKTIQSIYTFKDELRSTGIADVRDDRKMVKQILMAGAGNSGQRTISANSVNWQESDGWYLDLAIDGTATGERVTLDPDQQLGVLRIVSNLPDGTPCRPGAQSWLYEFDYLTGSYLPLAQDQVVGRKISSGTLSAGARTLKLGDKTVTLLTDESGKLNNMPGLAATASVNPVRRVSWRELDEQ